MYNTSPPDPPTSNDSNELGDYASNVWQYLTNMFRIGMVVTQLPNTSILDKMQSLNDKGQQGKIFYVSNGATGTFYRTRLEAGALIYEAF